jgi:hypothetical protein
LLQLKQEQSHIVPKIAIILSICIFPYISGYASAQTISSMDNSTANSSPIPSISSSLQQSMSVSVRSAKNPVMAGSMQLVSIDVKDANGNAVKDASVTATIDFPQLEQASKDFSGKTDSNGKWSFSWQIDSGSETGMYGVDVKASATGIDDAFGSAFFQVTANK